MMRIKSACLMVFIMISASLAGCVVEDGDEPDTGPEDFGIDSLPVEAIGLNLPYIDGQIFRTFLGIGYDEWIDSYTFPSSEISYFGDHGGKINDGEIGLHIKSIGDHVAIALEVPFEEGVDVNVASVKSEFSYDGDFGLLYSMRSASIGEPEEPWLEESVLPCDIISHPCDSAFSLKTTEPFEAVLIENETESDVLFTGLDLDLVATLGVVIEHSLAATQTSSMLTLETMRWDALRFSRGVPSVSITITFDDGDEIIIGEDLLDNLYFGYMQPSGWDDADVEIEGLELIQVVQTENMDMPLVKNKPTLARVYVSSGQSSPLNVEVDLKACVLIFCSAPMTKQISAPATIDREDFDASANFVIPEDWLGFDNVLIVADARIPYLAEMDDPDTSNNRWVEVFELTETSSLTVGYIRVGQDTDSDSALDQLSVARAQKTMSYSLDLFPINDYTIQSWNWNAGGSMYDATGCSNSQCVENLSAAFDNYLTQVIGAWIESDCVMEMGFWGDCPLPPIPDQLGALFPPGGTTGGISDPGWLSGSSFVFTCSYGSSSRVHCPAHEMNHNFGPAQGWCTLFIDSNSNGVVDFPGECTEFGGYGPGEWGEHLSKTGVKATDDCSAGGIDSVWNGIYGTAGQPFNIKDLGWNYRDTDAENSQSALIPSAFPDIMTYCQAVLAGADLSGGDYVVPYNAEDTDIDKWMSTYRWLRMHDKFSEHEEWAPDGGAFARQSFNPDSHIIRVVHLEFNKNHEVVELRSDITSGVINEKYGTMDNDVRDGQYTIVALDNNDNLVDSRIINLEFNDSHGHERQLSAHHVRFEDRGNIASIKVIDRLPGRSIASISSSVDVRAGGAKYDVNMDSTTYERGSEMKIEWDQINENGFQYSVEYSKGDGIWYPISGWVDGGGGVFPVSNLPASDNALIRVQMNNGFDSAFMYSMPFKVENQAPTLDVDIRAGHLTINSALPQPHLIPMDGELHWNNISESMRDRLEKDAEEVLSRAMRMPDIVIPQHGSITITPNVQDLDWEVMNDQGCEISLEKDGRVVWTTNDSRKIDLNSVDAEILSTYAIDNIFADSKNEPCTSRNRQFSSITFPNPEFTASMMMPGEYSLKIEYSDSGGAAAEPVRVDFRVGLSDPQAPWPQNFEMVEEYREKLVFVDREGQVNDAFDAWLRGRALTRSEVLEEIEELCNGWSTFDGDIEANTFTGVQNDSGMKNNDWMDAKDAYDIDMGTVCIFTRGEPGSSSGYVRVYRSNG